jgi:copper resistance protein C
MRRLFFILSMALALGHATLPIQVAYAAADLVSSSPAAGATVDATLAEVRIVFSEAITAESTLTLVDEQGAVVTDDSRLASDDANARTLVLAMRNLEPGNYTVSWFTVSANDLSLAEGSFTFTVTAAAAPSVTSQPSAAATRAPTSAPTARATQPSAAATARATVQPTERATARTTVQPTARATVQPTAQATERPVGGTTTNSGGDNTAKPTAQPREIPSTSSLPNTAGGAPAAWGFGIVAGLAALAVWGMRRRMR